MNPADCEKTKLVARVEVQDYFNHYLEEVFPEQLERSITAHNLDVTAHSVQIKTAIKAESSRVRLWIVGLIFAGGFGGGVGVSKALAFFMGN